ncbi:DUF2608 domain-containing protein [bacterium]|nr:DUF2608 domain-containing protein [bacterium]
MKSRSKMPTRLPHFYKHTTTWLCLVMCFFFLAVCSVQAEVTTKNFKKFSNLLESVKMEIEDYKPEDVLIVFDIDNTLLKMDDLLGGVEWWNWQSNSIQLSKIKKDLKKPAGKFLEVCETSNLTAVMDAFELFDASHTLASKTNELMEYQGMLYAYGKMSPPEKKIPDIISKFQNDGYPVFALTSRSPQYRYITMRELHSNGYNLAATRPEVKKGFEHIVQLPHKTNDPPIREELADVWKKSPREVIYTNGVFFTAGQDKSLMLAILMEKANIQPKVVILVDDSTKHQKEMLTGFKNETIMKVYSYHYTFANKTLSDDDIDLLNRDWEQFSQKYKVK